MRGLSTVYTHSLDAKGTFETISRLEAVVSVYKFKFNNANTLKRAAGGGRKTC